MLGWTLSWNICPRQYFSKYCQIGLAFCVNSLIHYFTHSYIAFWTFTTWITHSGTTDTKMNETAPASCDLPVRGTTMYASWYVTHSTVMRYTNAGVQQGVRKHGPKVSQSCLGESGNALQSIYGRKTGAKGRGQRGVVRGRLGQIEKSIGCPIWLPL